MKSPSTTHAQRDLLVVLLLVVLSVVVSVRFEISEITSGWLQTQERFQLDEVPLILLVVSLGLAWFAFRRVSEITSLLMTNRELTQRLIRAQEDERRLLAQELHDEVGQVCTALRFEAAYLHQAIGSRPQDALASAQRVDQSALHMHSLARDMLKRLRPANLDSLGFVESVKTLCQSWEQQHGITCTLQLNDPPVDVTDPMSTQLYRVLQEALTNVAKHAHASQVWVALHAQDDHLVLSITDNGLGHSTDQPSAGLGLLGMRERVASLGGDISISNAHPGLHILVRAPLTRGPA